MTPLAESFTSTLSFLTLIGLLLGAFLLVLRFLPMRRTAFFETRLLPILQAYSLHLALFVSLLGVIGSLFYSNVFGFTPCTLCWWARIFLYPQTLILIIALIRKTEAGAVIYCKALSFAGLLVAAYHSYIQLGGAPLIPCAINPNGGGCEVRYFIDYGFVTLPLMGLTVFIIILGLLSFHKRTY